MGCSTGGRQAFVEAQRFPADFDGIIAGAPPLNEIGDGVGLAWSVRANTDAQGHYILQQKDAELINDAVVAACDMNDGIKDGLIGDPRMCKFDVASLRCGKSNNAKACLSDAKIEAAQKIYSGPVDSHGRKIGKVGGPMPGSERYWIGDYVPRDSGPPPQYASFIESFFRYMAFSPSPDMSWRLKDLDFDRDPARFDNAEFLYNAENPDLRRYRDSGGKLLFFQGWADTSVMPSSSVDYYETATRVLGGPEETGKFFRFFTVPGMRHCSADGNGADAIDYLSVIESWVEKGQAPEVLVGQNYNQKGLPLRSLVFPLDPARVGLKRPHFPWPARAEYIGSGDPNDIANYRPVMPAAASSATH
jgi:feruloyl esterase